MYTYFSSLLILLLLAPTTISTTNKVQSLNQTTSAEARVHFDNGLRLLHNFEYDDAAEEFLLAQKDDPDFVMAYWGEAMTYNHPLWSQLDIEKARATLDKLGKTSVAREAKAKTALEKDLIQALEILYGKETKPLRDSVYAVRMGTLKDKYPGDHDVAAFYALSLLGALKSQNTWTENNVTAAAVTGAILKEDPNHPGALHYSIHAYDHPHHASAALDVAKNYPKAASYSDHAQHMPAHIYLALGMWDEEVKANEVSWKASMDRKERKKLGNDALDYHSYLWLAYGYLQQGKFQRAKAIIQEQIKYTEELPSEDAKAHLLQMKGHYLFTTGEWNSDIASIDVNTDDMDAGSHFIAYFYDGYKWYTRGNVVELEKVITQFENYLAQAKVSQQESDGIPICGVTRYKKTPPTAMDIMIGGRYVKRLQGLRAWLKNDMPEAEKLFKEVLPREGTVVIGPPPAAFGSYELYGKFLMASNRPAEALQQYQKSLDVMPNRYLSLMGKLAASKKAGDTRAEAETQKQLQETLKSADPGISKKIFESVGN